jgi:hypothetical protein
MPKKLTTAQVLAIMQKAYEEFREERRSFVVWWTAPEDRAKIGPTLPGDTPEYLAREYTGMYHFMYHQGPGYVKTPREIRRERERSMLPGLYPRFSGAVKVMPQKTEFAKKIMATCCGIVIRNDGDAEHVCNLPGVITSLLVAPMWMNGRFAMSEEDREEVEAILREGWNNPLPSDESRRILTACFKQMRVGAEKRGDTQTLGNLPKTEEEIAEAVERIVRKREEWIAEHGRRNADNPKQDDRGQ